MSNAKEKLTVVVAAADKAALTKWAREESRPLGNLLRVIIGQSLAQHRQQQAGRSA